MPECKTAKIKCQSTSVIRRKGIAKAWSAKRANKVQYAKCNKTKMKCQSTECNFELRGFSNAKAQLQQEQTKYRCQKKKCQALSTVMGDQVDSSPANEEMSGGGFTQLESSPANV